MCNPQALAEDIYRPIAELPGHHQRGRDPDHPFGIQEVSQEQASLEGQAKNLSGKRRLHQDHPEKEAHPPDLLYPFQPGNRTPQVVSHALGMFQEPLPLNEAKRGQPRGARDRVTTNRERIVDRAIESGRRGPTSSGADELGLALGDDVKHAQWGEGVIIDVEGSGDKAEAIIHFPSVGEKRLLLSWAPLEKI